MSQLGNDLDSWLDRVLVLASVSTASNDSNEHGNTGDTMSVKVIAKNVKGHALTVKAVTEFKTIADATKALASIKSGVNADGKRNRVASYDVQVVKSGNITRFERDDNGVPVKVKGSARKSPVAPVKAVKVKAVAPTKNVARNMTIGTVKPKVRLKSMTDIYRHGSGNSLIVTITAGKGGGKVYSVRTISKAVKGVKGKSKGKVIKPAIDATRVVTGHELVHVIMPHFDNMGYRLVSRDKVPA